MSEAQVFHTFGECGLQQYPLNDSTVLPGEGGRVGRRTEEQEGELTVRRLHGSERPGGGGAHYWMGLHDWAANYSPDLWEGDMQGGHGNPVIKSQFCLDSMASARQRLFIPVFVLLQADLYRGTSW